MPHHVDDFARGVGVVDEALVSHVPQLSEGQHQLPQHALRHARPVLTQHRQLRLDARVVDGVTAEDVTCEHVYYILKSFSPSVIKCEIAYVWRPHTQHRQLRLDVRVVDGVTAEDVTCEHVYYILKSFSPSVIKCEIAYVWRPHFPSGIKNFLTRLDLT